MLRYALGGLIVGYLLLCGLLYAVQERLIFHPHAFAAELPFGFGEERSVTTADGKELSTVWIDRPGDEVLIYFHGNVGNNKRGYAQMKRLRELDRDLVLVDYRGFGKSQGQPESDEQLLADMQAVYDSVRVSYPESSIHLLGYSLGTGMAAYLAAENSPASLTMLAPYTSLTDMKNIGFWWVPDALLKYRLDTRSRLEQIRCPVRVYHSRADELIPFEMGSSLVERARALGRDWTLHELEAASHRQTVLQLRPEWLGLSTN